MNEINLLEQALNLATGSGVYKSMVEVNQIGHCVGIVKEKLKAAEAAQKELEELRGIVAKQNEAAANRPGPSLKKDSPINHKGN